MNIDSKAQKVMPTGYATEQAEQEPVDSQDLTIAYMVGYEKGKDAAPVRTKDLTDDEIDEIWTQTPWSEFFHFARAVIAADREKNK